MAERTTSHVVGATLIGGMVGAGAALLFAPRSGQETRSKIADNVGHMKAGAAERLQQAKAKLSRGADEADELKDRVTQAARKTGRKAKSEMKELNTEMGRKRRQSPVLSAWEEEV